MASVFRIEQIFMKNDLIKIVFIDVLYYTFKNLSAPAAAEIYSHEANGHGLLYLRNGKDHKGAGHQVGSDLREKNTTLHDMIIESKQETILNMKK